MDKKLKILLADDDQIAVKPVVMAMEAKDLAVTVVKNGEEAVESVKKNVYDLILMDCDMPVMDGFVATETIREWEKKEGRDPVTIFALTSLNQFGASLTKEAGMNGHLEKPIRLAMIEDVIAKVKSGKIGTPS